MAIIRIEDIEKSLKKIGYTKLKRLSSKRLAVITEKNRKDVLLNLEKKFFLHGAKFDPTPSSVSSIGVLNIGRDLSIIAKPASMQGAKSAGIQNELMVINSINNMIAENEGSGIDVKFTSGSKTYLCRDIVKCVEVGRDTSGRKKADLICVASNKKEYPISIKQDNAEFWESADRYWASKAAKIIDKSVEAGLVRLDKEPEGHYTLFPNLAIAADRGEINNVVFGSDLTMGGAVITRTFSSSDFAFDTSKNQLTIKVSNIITNISEIPDKAKVFFLIRNDRTRNNINLPKGIRVLAAYKSRINKNVLVIQ